MIKLYRPVDKKFRISSPFGWRQDPINKDIGKLHNGIDFAAPIGTEVAAMASGHIVRVGFENEKDEKQGFGLRIIQETEIDDKKYYLTYAHLSQIWVAEGQTVSAGKVLGLTGNTGRSSGPHIHVQARERDTSAYADIEFMDLEADVA